MPFIFEKSSSSQWPSLQSEHDLVANRGKRSRRSEHLDHRVADLERGIVLYCVAGLGMGDGQRFALVYARQLVWFEVLVVKGQADLGLTLRRVARVAIPERLDAKRQEITAVFFEALTVYEQAYSLFQAPTHLHLDYATTQWDVVPRPNSWRHWKPKLAHAWARRKAQLTKAWVYVSSPLVHVLLLGLLLALNASGEPVPLWSVMLLGVCLAHRLDWYNPQNRFGFWLVGISEPKNLLDRYGLDALRPRWMNPVPLRWMTAELCMVQGDVSHVKVRLTNHSWFVVREVYLSATQVADAVAPGFCAALRANNKGALDSKALDLALPSLKRKWLLPKQSAHWLVPTVHGFAMHSLPAHVEVIVSVSRWATGEKTQGPRPFLVAVREPHRR